MAQLHHHTEKAENANVRVWELITDSTGLAKYLYDPLDQRFYHRLVRTEGMETRCEELKPHVAGVAVGDFIPNLLVEAPGTIVEDHLCFSVAGGDVKVASVEKVESTLDPRVARARVRSGEKKNRRRLPPRRSVLSAGLQF